LKLRQAHPKLAAVRAAVSAEPCRIGADETEAVQLDDADEVVRFVVQLRRGYAEALGELNEGFKQRCERV
jgi:hypothetical protein